MTAIERLKDCNDAIEALRFKRDCIIADNNITWADLAQMGMRTEAVNRYRATNNSDLRTAFEAVKNYIDNLRYTESKD